MQKALAPLVIANVTVLSLLNGLVLAQSSYPAQALLAVAGPPDGTGGCGGTGSYTVNVIGGTISRTGDTAFNNWAVGYRCWRFDDQYVRVYIVADDPATFDHWASPSGHLYLIDGHNGTSAATIETSFNTLGQSPTFEAVHTGGGPTPDLIAVDRASGAGSSIGPLSGGASSAYPALAIDRRTMVMYAGGGEGAAILYTVNPATGALSAIGAAGSGITRIAAMDFRKDGTLFASVKVGSTGGPGANYLARMNPVTGAATLVGSFGTCDARCSIEGMGAIAFDDTGILYGALHERAQNGTPGLYTINTTTGRATFAAPIVDGTSNPPSGGITSLQFVNDTLYGGTAIAKTPPGDGGWLVTIDRTTGEFTKVGSSSATGGRGLIGLATSSFDCDFQADIPVEECEALVVLFDSTDGYQWTHDNGWKVTNAPCTWYGVSCVDGHVASLTLKSNRLNGSLPESIGSLARLTHLDASWNSLRGPLPESMRDLRELTWLDLNHYDLDGPIPAAIGDLTNLTYLNLHGSGLTGSIPNWIGNLGELTELDLAVNGLTGPLPESMGNLINLTLLSLYENGLQGPLPEAIGNLTSLETLSLSNNSITGSIPETIGNLTQLKALSIQANGLTGVLPTSIGNLINLSYLALSGNSLSGPIPESIGNLTELTILYLGSNSLTGPIPATIGNLTKLDELRLYQNHLAGPIPESIGGMSALRYLFAGGNELSGPIPPTFGNLTHLLQKDLSLNNLEGTIPLPAARIMSDWYSPYAPPSGQAVASLPPLPFCSVSDNPGLCVPDTPEYQALAYQGKICGLPLDPACPPIVHVGAKLLLEGPYSNGTMHAVPAFADHCPSAQPYSAAYFDGTPLDYDTPDVVPAPPDSVMDWILVSLRQGLDAASEVPGSERVAFLKTSGSVVDTNGTMLAFPGVAPGPYRLVVRHRNHASVMSADTLDLSDGIGSWDFTTAMTRAYSTGGNPMKDLHDGRFGMFACDINADGQITALDFTAWLASTTAGAHGYEQPDCNMDGIVTAIDFTKWLANTTAGAASRVPD